MTEHETATSKGTILKSLYGFIERELDGDQMKRFAERLDPGDAEYVGGKILSSRRVPESTLNRMTQIAAEELGEDLESFGRRAGRAELEDSVRVYKYLFAVMTPSGLLSRASSLWSTVHNRGKLVVVDSSDNSARVRLEDFPSERAHCARLSGWIEGLAEMTRVNDPVMTHDVCLAEGQGDCEWEVRWS